VDQLARAMENVQLDLLKQEEEEGVDEREVQRLKEQHAKHKGDLEQAGSDILLLEQDVAKQIVDIWQSAEKRIFDEARQKVAKLNEQKEQRLHPHLKRYEDLWAKRVLKYEFFFGQSLKESEAIKHEESEILLIERDAAKKIVDIWQSAAKRVQKEIQSELPDEAAHLKAMLEQVGTETMNALEEASWANETPESRWTWHPEIAEVVEHGYSKRRAEVALHKEQWDVDKALKRLAKESPKKSD